MNVTDCSVSNNPLARLNKHNERQSKNYNNVSGSRLNSEQIKSSQNDFKTATHVMSNTSRQMMNNFINPMVASSGAALNMGHSPMQTANSPMDAIRSHQVPSPPHEQAISFKPTATGSWSTEFQKDGLVSQKVPAAVAKSDSFRQNHFQQPLHPNLRYSRTMVQSSQLPLQQREIITPSASHNATADWDQQFKDLENEVSQTLKVSEQDTDAIIDTDYQTDFQHVWDSLQQDQDELINTRKYGTRIHENAIYNFATENEYKDNVNAYKIGCILMENGAKLSEAAMAFEAAVQQNPTHVDAWLKLGLVQTQNEKEINGISALETCLKLDPKNLEALKTLATGYINEGYDMSAFITLSKVIESKYPNLDSSIDQEINLLESELEDPPNLNEKITKKFLKLANQLPGVDSDIQLCLGLLYYANDDFDKTIECFKAALNENPTDELMWNRLGAALANSNRSEDSIKAYYKAIQLKPSFVRARYNLAVACMNIHCYKEAAEHLLTALSMHEVGTPNGKAIPEGLVIDSHNDNIMETLKRVFIALNRNDLADKVEPRMKLAEFRNEFTF
ncbi:hypothetical protein KAFR_0E02820 [Kazachstania africana CBS 2517]|uniref:Uncharacterized protein n=1 Tax=Kazachstania africana (strain ATCC 22294 / BCRC 22015 / CBS 2517 / CECT 1963 / NBRC 1671 / NRRL Y-8276) TaxID=1071382 RepID=H2AVN4_KAZAF|nr:hypothetical protein KAFR_0E02820 [Kazachstania africana CBS 2517]CCF58434.1 hypothetical protein KAFR_0E02820 [Kazachstania africana CBS 2517]